MYRYKGVTYQNHTGRWRAYMYTPSGKLQTFINLGYFHDEEDAAGL